MTTEIIAIVVVMIVVELLEKLKGGPLAFARGALVLSELKVDREEPIPVRMTGRKAGLIAWILTKIGIDPTTTLTVTEHRVEISEGSLSGRVVHRIPLCSVSNIGAGYSKPFGMLVAGVLLTVMGLCSAFAPGETSGSVIIFLMGAAACFADYCLCKTIALFVLSASGVGAHVAFKPGIIGAGAIDEAKAHEIVELVTDLVEKSMQEPRAMNVPH